MAVVQDRSRVQGAPRRRFRRPEDPKVALLAEMPLFAGCTRHELAAVAPLLEHAELPAGHVLLREREPQREVHLLVEGCVEATLDGHLLGVAGHGELLGDPALLRGLAPITWTAVTDVSVLLTTTYGFGHVVTRLPDLLPQLWGER